MSAAPVIALAKGGARETVIPGETGLFFHEQTPDALRDAVLEFERGEMVFDPATIRENAMRFSVRNFRRKLETVVMGLWERFSTEIDSEVHGEDIREPRVESIRLATRPLFPRRTTVNDMRPADPVSNPA